ncbi:MAG: ABC transporter ATP-binding protein [Leptospiraceae bacterium]|nr:ABC transporter ATP-binding protein [Leptospiraceae bacterium]
MSITVKNVNKIFPNSDIPVLNQINLEIDNGEFVALTGKSGSGKSTLLYIISSLDKPSSGSVLYDGVDVHSLDEKQIHDFRNTTIGFVFQFHYLLPELNVLENVLLPARKTNQHEVLEKTAIDLLQKFGLKEKLQRFPSQLSGGEQQRVSIARAMIMKPKYLFADEPTGNLDSKNGEIVLQIFKEINKELQTSIVMVTHEPDFAALAKKQILLVDGTINS